MLTKFHLKTWRKWNTEVVSDIFNTKAKWTGKITGHIPKMFTDASLIIIIIIIINVKWSRYRPGVAQRLSRGIALLFHDRDTRRGWVVSSTPRPHFIPGKDLVTHCTGGWVGPKARSGRAENLVTTGFGSRTVQAVVSRYTDWVTRPTTTTTTTTTTIVIMVIVIIIIIIIIPYRQQRRYWFGKSYLKLTLKNLD